MAFSNELRDQLPAGCERPEGPPPAAGADAIIAWQFRQDGGSPTPAR